MEVKKSKNRTFVRAQFGRGDESQPAVRETQGDLFMAAGYFTTAATHTRLVAAYQSEPNRPASVLF